MADTLVVLSGGMDSATLLYRALEDGGKVMGLSFDYGQRHVCEVVCAADLCKDNGIPHMTISLPLQKWLRSALTSDDIEVPDGHYAEETMMATVVPNRNAIMLSVAFGIGLSQGYDRIAAAFHAGDHFIYPDCRPEFVEAYQQMIEVATEGLYAPTLFAPYVLVTKAEIVRQGASMGVPYARTWSCYKGGEVHCGSCGTCVERREAFIVAKVPDPTSYLFNGPLPAAPF